jgi:SHS2 domain-containing protein
MSARFELFDHTADVGVRVLAPTRAELVPPATEGLYTVIGALATFDDGEPWSFEAHGDEPALMLRDYLAELLHLFDTRRTRITDIVVAAFEADHLVLAGQLRRIDPNRSHLEREVKAVTYHELSLVEQDGAFEATYIVDI